MKRILISVVLIFFIFSTSSIIYTEVVASEETYLENISDYYLTKQKLTSRNSSTLIPEGTIQGVNDVYYIEYQYELLIKDGKTLHANVKNLSMSNVDIDYETLDEIFNFEYSYETLETIDYHEDLFGAGVEANRVLVTLRISMNEPSTYEIFMLLASNQLSFNSYFFVG